MDDKVLILGNGGTKFEDEKNSKQDFLSTISLTSIGTNNDEYPDIENYQLLDNIDSKKDYEIKDKCK